MDNIIDVSKLNFTPKKLRNDLTKKQSNLLQSHKSHQKKNSEKEAYMTNNTSTDLKSYLKNLTPELQQDFDFLIREAWILARKADKVSEMPTYISVNKSDVPDLDKLPDIAAVSFLCKSETRVSMNPIFPILNISNDKVFFRVHDDVAELLQCILTENELNTETIIAGLQRLVEYRAENKD